jgi:LuxR family transcriptional regulator, quorum-sensing system regulator SdiA
MASFSIQREVDHAARSVTALGFEALIYDYSPVPRAHDGRLITPTVLESHRVPEEMIRLWREGGFYQLDPVQDAALEVSAPFVWSYVSEQSDVMRRVLREEHRPAVDYLRRSGLTFGITVPIRQPDGALATFTAIRVGASAEEVAPLARTLPELGLLGHRFHDEVAPRFPDKARACPVVQLTKRERECLGLCGKGLTAKEIAHQLCRSVPTVVFHLNSATRKLGARNRFQAIARAAHYRLL